MVADYTVGTVIVMATLATADRAQRRAGTRGEQPDSGNRPLAGRPADRPS
jgi:hypothetical protein